jgi:FkbM family methyltransferase
MQNYISNINFDNKLCSHIKIDIGLSYSAPFSQKWLEKEDNVLVIGFEPNPDCVSSILSGDIKKQHPSHGNPINSKYVNDRFFLIPVALSNVTNPTEMTFYKMQNDCGTSSLYKPSGTNIGPVKEIVTVPVYSLKHFFDLFPWDKYHLIDYIKIDAQGSDLDILKGAEHYLKEKVVYITAEPEYSHYEQCGHNNENSITDYLQSQGFVRVYHPNTEDPTFLNKNYLHLQDSIYICQS